MPWPPAPHVLLFVAVSALAFFNAWAVWRRRSSPGAIPLFLMFLMVGVWSVGYALEIWLVDAGLKLLTAKVQYVGIAYVSVAWLFFVLAQSGRQRWITPRLVILACIVPTVTLGLAWTNDFHGLLWRSLEVAPPERYGVLEVTYGPQFWVHTAYSYACLLMGAVFLLGMLVRQSQLFRREALLLLAVVLSPWLGNVGYLTGLDLLNGLDVTVIGFAVSGLIMARLFLPGDLLDLVPIARHTVFDEMLDGVLVMNVRGELVDVNRAAAAMLSGSVDTLVGRSCEEALASLEPVSDGARTFMRTHSGEKTLTYDATEVPLTDGRGHGVGRLVVLQDVTDQLAAERALKEAHRSLEARVRERTQDLMDTNAQMIQEIAERKRSQDALHRSEAELRNLFDDAPYGICRSSPAGRFLRVNPALVKMLGYESGDELLQLDLNRDVYVDPYERRRRVKRERGSGQLRWKRKDGQMITVRLSRRPVRNDADEIKYFEMLVEDVTERVELEAQLALGKKLEAVGQLAAGIAHEINTPLQYVGDNVHFLQSATEEYRALLEKYGTLREIVTGIPGNEDRLAEIRQAEKDADLPYLEENVPVSFAHAFDGIDRVSEIVRAMKDFSHPDQREKRPVDLNHALQNTLTVARNEYKYVADIETDLGELPPVICHAGEINQVFLNLIINAAHAIGEVNSGAEGRGTIRVRTVREDDDTALITIQDTGCGIPEAIGRRVFDPFFTTKKVGHGTGQGLATARSVVVDRHGGSLCFESEPGQGTTFIIRLPIRGNQSAKAATP